MVVDDSAFMRRIVSDAASQIEGIEVVGAARNGQEALENIPRLRPDIITMDIEMPQMDGIEALKVVRRDYPAIQVIMLSSYSKTGSDVTMEALKLGALDFIEKSMDRKNPGAGNLTAQLEEKLKVARILTGKGMSKDRNLNVEKSLPEDRRQLDGSELTEDRTLPEVRTSAEERKPAEEKRLPGSSDTSPSPQMVTESGSPYPGSAYDYRKVRAVVIGASTGGPKVLFQIIGSLPKGLSVPVFIVQHMPKGFTASFAERLDSECPLDVVEAKHNMAISPGVVYVAPGDSHMTIEYGRIRLDERPKVHGVRPAVDLLFESAVRRYGKETLGILLTGMGRDGASGMAAIREAGGYNLVQDKESCVVYGMPGHAAASGVVDEILTPEQIVERIRRIIQVNRWN
jgi:two-component system chemotaxis response regulator CheB